MNLLRVLVFIGALFFCSHASAQVTCNPAGNPSGSWLQSYGSYIIGDVAIFGPGCGQVQDSGGTSIKQETGNYAITASDCGSTIEMINGFNSLTLPSVSNVPLGCEVTFKNGDTSAGKKLINFPSDIISPILWPLQAGKVKSDGANWLTLVNPKRWKAPLNTTLYMDVINGNDANDCLAPGIGRACNSFNQVLRINVHDYFDVTGITTFSAGNLTGNANIFVQLADNATSPGACATCYAGLHADFSPLGHEGRASIVIRGDIANPQNVVIADSVAANNIDVYSPTFNMELDSLQIGQSSCSATPKTPGAGIQSNDHAIIRLERNVFVGCATGAQLSANSQGAINDDNGVTFVGGGGYMAAASDGGNMQLTNQIVTCSGTLTYSGATISSQRMGLVNLQSVTWSGCGSVTGTRFIANELSLITTGTGTPNTTIPGTVNGTPATGSQVD